MVISGMGRRVFPAACYRRRQYGLIMVTSVLDIWSCRNGKRPYLVFPGSGTGIAAAR